MWIRISGLSAHNVGVVFFWLRFFGRGKNDNILKAIYLMFRITVQKQCGFSTDFCVKLLPLYFTKLWADFDEIFSTVKEN